MKTRLNIITIACVLLFLGACQSKPDGFVLKGELSGAPEGKWIYLTDYDQKVYLDSTQLKDGCFEFQGQLDYPTLCRVTYFKDPAQRTYGWDNILSIPIFLENTAVHLSVPFNEMPAKSQDGMPASLQITGSQAHELYSTYLAAVAPLMMKDDSLFTEYRKAYYYKMGTEEDVFHYVREMDAVRNAIFNTGVAVIRDHPESPVALYIATTLNVAAQGREKAQEIAKNWLKSYPNNIFARHFNQEDVDKEYASKLFDNFASTYEKTLNKIKYNIPNELKKILNSPKGLIIDLGCGTGLVAQELKSADNTFIGIDISPAMLKIAETKKLYKELICTDITNWLKKSLPQNTNLIIAADVFCYMKDLSEIIKTCAPYPLCFTIEKSPSGKTELSASGRYQHSPQGINDLLRQNGYADIIQKKINLRQEDQTNVEGLIFFAT